MSETINSITGASIAQIKCATVDQNLIQRRIISLVSDMVADWGIDADEITPDTRLVADLEFVSVDIIHLVVAVEEDFKRPKMGFQELLMKDGRYVDEVTLRQLAEFVASKF